MLSAIPSPELRLGRPLLDETLHSVGVPFVTDLGEQLGSVGDTGLGGWAFSIASP
jgi:hypothetical protein